MHNNIGMSNYSETYFDRFCFWFVTIDLMFLPYLTFFSVSLSIPFIAFWMVLNCRGLFRDKEASIVVLIVIAMVISTVLSLFYAGDVRFETTFSTSVKRFFQYTLCFGYYFFYKSYFKKKYVDISRFVLIFVVYVAVFASLFLLFPLDYATLKIAINPADNHTRRYLEGIVYYRFNYLWVDPNNIAYLIDGLLCWYLIHSMCSLRKKVLMMLLSIMIVASTVSNGGLIILTFALCILVLRRFGQFIKHVKIRVRNILFIAFLIFAGSVVVTSMDAGKYIYETFMTQFEKRFESYSESNNISGGRFNDLKIAVDYIAPVFLIIGSGKEGFSSENGHLYWICMYGALSYPCLMWLLFRKSKVMLWRDYIWILPFFVAFTMNIAIGEFKWMAIYLMMLAYSRYSIGYSNKHIRG